MDVPIYLLQAYILYYLLRHCEFFMEHFEISLAVSKIEYRDRAGRKRAWKIGLPTTCYRKHYTLDASCISSHYVHSVQFCPRKFPIKIHDLLVILLSSAIYFLYLL